MPEFDTVIKGGTIVDGLRTPRFTADVGVKDGRIAYLGRIESSDAETILDASGLIVAPGFVDLHTHYDAQIYWDPYCTLSGWHGVTSVVIGNCGFGFAPIKPEERDRAMLMLSRNEAIPLESMQEGMPWDWETFPEFLDSLDRTPKGVNLLSYCGVSPLMMSVMGLEAAKSRSATDEERAAMCELLDEAMTAGACGFSAQWTGPNSGQRDYDGTPMISDTMSQRELFAFAEVLAKRREGFIQVTGGGGEGPTETHALHEKLAEVSGRPVLHNVISFFTDQHGVPMGNYQEALAWLEEANARGNRVYGQAVTVTLGYDFTFEDWNLFDSRPLWAEACVGTVEERTVKLADPERRRALKDEYDRGEGPTVAFAGTMEDLLVAEVEDPGLKDLEGLTIQEIVDRENKHPIDAMLDLAVADKLRTLFHIKGGAPNVEAMKEVAGGPFSLPGVSDGGAHTKFLTLGVYPTEFIATIVRDQGIMDLEQAHWRLSGYPAQAAGFKDRGWIREGAPADIVVYDYENLKILPREKVYDQPAGAWRRIERAEGYRWILVNGEVTFEDGECTGATPGQLLRHGVGAS